MPTGKFFNHPFKGLAGFGYKGLGGKARFVIYRHKSSYFIYLHGQQKGNAPWPRLYAIDPKIYHETYMRYLNLKNRFPGAEKIARNFSKSPQKLVAIKIPWRCPDKILCSYLAAIR